MPTHITPPQTPEERTAKSVFDEAAATVPQTPSPHGAIPLVLGVAVAFCTLMALPTVVDAARGDKVAVARIQQTMRILMHRF